MPAMAGGPPDSVTGRTVPVFQRLESLADIAGRFQRRQTGGSGLSEIVFDPTDMDAMVLRLEELRTRHRELDLTIETLKSSGADDIRLMSLKREKLRLKDSIVWLSSRITPDIIA